MTASASRRVWLATVLLGVTTSIAVCLVLLRSRPALPVVSRVPGFSLVDQTGGTFGSEQLAGSVWVASFIYTTCEGPCPVIVSRLATLARTFADEPDFRLVSFTVDPQIDTPQVLARYGAGHSIDPQRWKLLTGKSATIFGLIRHGFFLPVAQASGGNRRDAERVTHSVRAVLVDRNMQIRTTYNATDADQIEHLAEDVRRLLRQKKGS